MSDKLPAVQNLRVAIILSELRPGGMERLVVHLATTLADHGVPVQVICLQSSGVLAPLLINENIDVTALESHSGKDFGALWNLKKELNKFQPSIIHLHDYASLPYAVIANLLAGRRPIVFTAHGLLYDGFEHLQKRLRFFSKFLTAFSAVSEKVAQRHRDYLRWNKPVQVIANGVPSIVIDPHKRKQVRDELGCVGKTQLFLAVGNPRPEKGFEDLLDAVALLRQKNDNFLVVVAGTLTESEYCQSLLVKLEQLSLNSHFKFLGFRQDTEALYSAADVFVLSSRSEGLPMVILEAMTAGLPVIATAVGGIPDAIGDKALLVDAQNPTAMAEAMERLMVDSALRVKFSQMGKAHVEKSFGLERMGDEYLEWYNRVLNTVIKK